MAFEFNQILYNKYGKDKYNEIISKLLFWYYKQIIKIYLQLFSKKLYFF